MADDELVNVRYMVDDVDAAIAFYTRMLGFELLTSRVTGVRRREAGPPALAARWTDELGGTADARRTRTRAGRLEPHPLHRRRPRRARSPACTTPGPPSATTS